MQELQSDDFFVPELLLKLPRKSETDRRKAQTEDFLKGVKGWTEYFLVDECVE